MATFDLTGQNLVFGPTEEEYINEYVKNGNGVYFGSYLDIRTIIAYLATYYTKARVTKSISIMWISTGSGIITEGASSIIYNKYDMLITNKLDDGTISTTRLKNMVNYGLTV